MKFNVKRFSIILVSIMAGSFIIAGIVFYATGGISAVSVSPSQVSTSKTYNAEEIEKIIVNTVNTDIDVIPAVIKDIDIDFYGSIRTNLARGIPELRTYLENGTLNIDITHPRTINIGLINLFQLQLDIYVPGDYFGDITVNTFSGALDIRELGLGSLDFKSTSGELRGDSVNAGELKIRSTSGEVNIVKSEGALDINTISGDISVSLNAPVDDLQLKTISGDVLIELPEESEFVFALSSVSGDISNEFGATISNADKGKLEGTVGEGAFKITVESTSGYINIVKGEK